MSSANEHLAPPPKPRMSPLDFRNTDLVSRLLAATPPYLYNMSLLPNTYFFSEMLRSFVQAKADPANNRSIPGSLHGRRTRKRPWTATRMESFQKPSISPKPEHSNDWHLKNTYSEHRIAETPLELTTRPVLENSNRVPDNDDKVLSQNKVDNFSLLERKTEIPLHNPVFPSPHTNTSQDANASSLILPPPPPMWYPPLYPTAPYGIDPLHFFIDLRVSGHIYDRKNQKDTSGTEVSSSTSKITEDLNNREQFQIKDPFKQSRHASAFSVPVPHLIKTSPMNLSHNEEHVQETKNIKFDVKSMGFEKISNRTGTNYIMSNIGNIFKNVEDNKAQIIKNEEIPSNSATNDNNDNETEEQKQKRVKDLRALIGLELVVDYMNHAKPQVRRIPEESSSTDMESVDSPTLEVVALHDET